MEQPDLIRFSLVATQFAQINRWSFHYLVSLGIALSNTLLLLWIFRGRTQEECLADIGQAPDEGSSSEMNYFRRVLGMRNVHLLAAFILVYVGVEVTIGGKHAFLAILSDTFGKPTRT